MQAALDVERWQHRHILSALQMVAWTNVAVWGADISPGDLLPLPWGEPRAQDEDRQPWSYEETIKSGIGMLDYLSK